jgi:hypothetical protein
VINAAQLIHNLLSHFASQFRDGAGEAYSSLEQQLQMIIRVNFELLVYNGMANLIKEATVG